MGCLSYGGGATEGATASILHPQAATTTDSVKRRPDEVRRPGRCYTLHGKNAI